MPFNATKKEYEETCMPILNGMKKSIDSAAIVFSKKAEEYLNKGISYNPKRLDLQFKRVTFYSLKHDYKKEYDLLVKLLSLDKKYKTKWLWKKNTPLNQTDIDFKTSMYDFINFLIIT